MLDLYKNKTDFCIFYSLASAPDHFEFRADIATNVEVVAKNIYGDMVFVLLKSA